MYSCVYSLKHLIDWRSATIHYVLIDRPSKQFNAALNFYWQFHALLCNNFRGTTIMTAISVPRRARDFVAATAATAIDLCLCVKYY